MKLNIDSARHTQHISYMYTNTKPALHWLTEGANGGIAGNDIRCIATCSDKTVNIMGIDNHQLCSILLVTAGGVYQSQLGHFALNFCQYARYGKIKSIHSLV